MNKILTCLAALAAITWLNSCSCSQQEGDLKNLDAENDTTQQGALEVSPEVVNDMIQNISSPVEMANEIKNSGVQFQQSTLNEAGLEGKYETSFKRAINLGVYAADLGYINTFGKNLVVVDYLSSIKRLADGLNVGQFLDFNTLSRLAKNSTNLDSLKQLSISSFNEIDRYLRSQKRPNVSTAIVVGTWIEGIYITSSVIEQTRNSNLINRLGEQKNIVEILQIVVKNYADTDSNFKTLAKQIDGLKSVFDNVRITTEMGTPETKEVNGMLVIEQNEITHVEISDETVEQIISTVKDIRNDIVK